MDTILGLKVLWFKSCSFYDSLTAKPRVKIGRLTLFVAAIFKGDEIFNLMENSVALRLLRILWF